MAPLDWGLGHASRCVPIVRELLRQGTEVYLASSGPALAYLKAVFPDIPALTLPAYAVRYPTRNMLWNMLVQSPRLLYTAIAEHFVLRRLMREYNIRAVVSDNRFGCFTSDLPCAFISHQLQLPLGGWVGVAAQRINGRVIRQYTHCWVPDVSGAGSLGGRLSESLPRISTTYLGSLSQLPAVPAAAPPVYDWLFLLSGPEPQRTYLEQELLTEFGRMRGQRALLVRGLPQKKADPLAIPAGMEVIDFATQSVLAEYLVKTRYVVCRSGYSTLMDLAVLSKKALLIPTPGQPEQQYLAERMEMKGFCSTQQQGQVDLVKADGMLEGYTGLPNCYQRPGQLRAAVEQLLLSL